MFVYSPLPKNNILNSFSLHFGSIHVSKIGVLLPFFSKIGICLIFYTAIIIELIKFEKDTILKIMFV